MSVVMLVRCYCVVVVLTRMCYSMVEVLLEVVLLWRVVVEMVGSLCCGFGRQSWERLLRGMGSRGLRLRVGLVLLMSRVRVLMSCCIRLVAFAGSARVLRMFESMAEWLLVWRGVFGGCI